MSMDQKQYTFSNKDKKLLMAIAFMQIGLIFFCVSMLGFYYHHKISDCRRLNERLELADWATGEVDKAKSRLKIEAIKKSHESQGIGVNEFYK